MPISSRSVAIGGKLFKSHSLKQIGLKLLNDTQYRVVRFVVYDEPIWRFNDLITIAPGVVGFTQIGEARIEPCDEGLAVLLAVKPFRDLRIAEAAYGTEWRARAVAALKLHFRKQTPTGVLRLIRDPVNGSLQNIAE